MNDEELKNAFSSLWDDIDPRTVSTKHAPKLAHYTSIDSLEKIIQSGEIWLSNPLNMNDYEELKLGINLGIEAFLSNEKKLLDACKSQSTLDLLKDYFFQHIKQLDQEGALDIYVLCFSEHSEKDNDGLLSMWRGYGQNGNGVAIIIDGKKLPINDGLPLNVAKVNYKSRFEREAIANNLLNKFIELITQTNPLDTQLNLVAKILIKRLIRFALFYKHNGFSEEREWRVVYFRDDDLNRKYEKMLGYSIGPNGITPKLKLKIVPSDGLLDKDFKIIDIVENILLGPSISNSLAKLGIERMLENYDILGAQDKIKFSTTPYRPT